MAAKLASLLEGASGIAIPEHELEGLAKKASSLVPKGVSLSAYLVHVTANSAELQHFVERMCTHETRFFRHPEQFEVVERDWIPVRTKATQRRRVRAWSVACSSGEEPFSLAMMLLDHFPSAAGWHVEVLGTDISSQVLARARAATWPIERSCEIDTKRLDLYMLRGRRRHAGLMRATPELRSAVQLQQLNLIDRPYSIGGDFDLVFLRNVLIYFAGPTRRSVVKAVMAVMAPGSMLVTGPSEGISHLEESRLKAVAPHVFVYAG